MTWRSCLSSLSQPTDIFIQESHVIDLLNCMIMPAIPAFIMDFFLSHTQPLFCAFINQGLIQPGNKSFCRFVGNGTGMRQNNIQLIS